MTKYQFTDVTGRPPSDANRAGLRLIYPRLNLLYRRAPFLRTSNIRAKVTVLDPIKIIFKKKKFYYIFFILTSKILCYLHL